MLRRVSEIRAVPFRGGNVTVREKALIPFGGYSRLQNLRNTHPGLEMRKGQKKLHTTADDTNSVTTLYQFNKSRVSDNHLFAQMSDGDILEATTDPPGVTTGAFGADSLPATPWLSDWAKRVKVTLDATKFGSDLAHFPHGVHLSTSCGISAEDLSAIFDELGSDANRFKIAVTKSDAVTQLFVEIEYWTDAGEDAWLWVSKSDWTALSAGTVLYIYYDATKSDNTSFVSDKGDTAAQSVWDSLFELVVHHAEDPSGGAGTILDSTGNNNDGAGQNMETGDLATGGFGRQHDFDGTDEYISVPDDDTLSFGDASDDEAMTIEMFANMDDATGFRGVNKAVDPNYEYAFGTDGSDKLIFTLYDATSGNREGRLQDGTLTAKEGTYTHLSGSYDGSGGATASAGLVLYVDGVLEASAANDAGAYDSMHNTGAALGIGGFLSGAPSYANGKISETRISRTQRSADWLLATTHALNDNINTFGDEVAFADIDAPGNQIPASWNVINDHLLFSNGAFQHKLYSGDGSTIDMAVVYDGSAAPPNVPELGRDYSIEIADGLSDTFLVLNSLDTYANFETVFFMTPVPIISLTFTISKANTNSSVATLYYKNSAGAWNDTGMTDGTDSGGATLAQTGTMSLTGPVDEISSYQYGASGFWYQLRVSAQLSNNVKISSITYGSQWQDIRNVWDGIPQFAVEAQVEGTSAFALYGAGSVDLISLAAGKKIMIAATDPIEAVYIDPGETPNATGTALTSFKYWDGTAFQTVGTVTDGTSGMSNPGWITFPRQNAQPHQFGGSSIYAYWYEMIWDSQLGADVVVGIQVMPFFDIGDFGPKGLANCVWKDRAVVNFGLFPQFLYVASGSLPFGFNGTDFGILIAGDGRANKVVSMERFHNELLVYQEERGVHGGCITLFEGYSPTTFGKLLLSERIGSMNAKSTAVVDGVLTSTATDEVIKTLSFNLSRYGVFATDGRTVSAVSDDIGNYFEPTDPACIRRNYENEMWLKYDSAYNVIRIGLVSGSLCTGTDIAFVDSDPDTITTAGSVDFVASGIKVGMKFTTSSATNTGTYTVATVSSTTITLISGDSLSAEGSGSFTLYPASPNVFPVLDLTDKTWSFDDLGQTLGCMTEAEALSGNVPVIQLGGGIGDGFVYYLNTTDDDVSTAIDSHAIMELDMEGEIFNLRELLIRTKAQSSGDLKLTITENELASVTDKALSMISERTGQTIRRHRVKLNVMDQHMAIKLQVDGSGEDLTLIDIGMNIGIWENA